MAAPEGNQNAIVNATDYPPGTLVTEVTSTTTTTVVEVVTRTYTTPAATPSASPKKRPISLLTLTPPSSPITTKRPISLCTITPPSSPITAMPQTVHVTLRSPAKRSAKGQKPSIPPLKPKTPRPPNPPLHWVPHPEYLQKLEEGEVFDGYHLIIVGQSCGLFFSWGKFLAAVAGVDGCRHSNHKSHEEALKVYTTAYFAHEVLAYPLPGSKFWTPPLGKDCMRSISESWAPETPSSSSSAFWGYDDGDGNESYEPRGCGNAGARSTALEMQLEFMHFDEDSD